MPSSASWRARFAALDQYYSTHGRADPIRIGIPKGSYVPTFQLNAGTAQSGPATDTGAASNKSPGLEAGLAIAVVPFRYLGQDPQDAYLAGGLTQEFLVTLARWPELKVIGPLSRLEAQPVVPREIGREYGVRFVLQGTVRKSGTAIRVSPSLSETTTGQYLWGQTYEYDLERVSLFEIEDQVAGQVAAAIADSFGVMRRHLLPEARRAHLESVSATEAILKFNYAGLTYTPDAVLQAKEALEAVLATDPENALLLAVLAGLYFMELLNEWGLLPNAWELSEELTLRAVSLDANCQLAHYGLASVHWIKGRRMQCIEAARRTVALDPNNPNCVGGCGFLLAMVGEWEEGLELVSREMQLNPHYPSWRRIVFFMDHYRRGEYEEALAEANRIKLPLSFWYPLMQAAATGQLGRPEEAERALAEMLRRRPDFPSRARDLMRHLVFSEEHVEMLMEGLLKAGLREQT